MWEKQSNSDEMFLVNKPFLNSKLDPIDSLQDVT